MSDSLVLRSATTGSAAAPRPRLPPTDALPYYDREIDEVPGLRTRVEREVAAEMARAGATTQANARVPDSDARLPPVPQLLKDRPDLQAELQRVAARQPPSAIDYTRYRVDAPKEGEKASPEEWEQALRLAEAGLGHAETRRGNLELEKKFGANLWRLHNFQQEAFLTRYSAAASDLTAQTAELDRARRQAQVKGGEQLSRLEARWAELISKNLQIEVGCIAAEGECEALEEQKRSLQSRLAAMGE